MSKGFTIVELLVGASIFLLLLGGAIGSLVYSLRLQKMVFARQGVASELSFAVEYMSRALRFAQKESPSEDCLDQEGQTYDIGDVGKKVTFINHFQDDSCQSFFLEEGFYPDVASLMYEGQDGSSLPLTSPDVDITNLTFEVDGDQEQPMVTITIKAESEAIRQPLNIQTSVSSRVLNVEI